MFTPEAVNEERGEYIIVANHHLESEEAARMSITYNLGRIAFGKSQLPPTINSCRLVYDLRGQAVSDTVIDQIRQALDHHCTLEFRR